MSAWLGGSFGEAYSVLGVLDTNPYTDRLCLFSKNLKSVIAMRTVRPEHVSDPNVVLRFHEVMAPWVSMAPHPNILRALYAEEIGGHPFLATDWIAADERGLWSLRRIWERHTPELTHILRWMCDLCDGLEEAAVAGLEPHLSLHPSCLYVTFDGRLVIDGFGLVQTLCESPLFRAPHVHRVGDTIGLASYPNPNGIGLGFPTHMAPEQFTNVRSCGHDATMYAIGVLLYQLCTAGRLPYTFDTHDDPEALLGEAYRAHRDGALDPLQTPLMGIIYRLLEQDPQARYPSYGDLRDEFVDVAREQNVALPDMAPDRSWDGEAWVNRALGLHAMGFGEEALAAYVRAEDKLSDHHVLWRHRASCLNGLDRHEEAQQAADKAIELYPEASFAWRERGIALQAMGQAREGLAAFERAAEIRPREPSFSCSQAHALLTQGRAKEGIALFESVRALKLNDQVVLQQVGAGLSAAGRYAEGLECLDRAVAQEVRRASLWRTRARVLADGTRWADSIQSLLRAIELDPSWAVLWFELGLAREALGELEEAAQAYKEYLHLAASRDLTRVREAKLRLKGLLKVGVAQAHRSNMGVVSRHGSLHGTTADATRHHQQGLRAHEQGRYQEAIEAFGRALGYDPLHIAVWLDAAETLLVTGQFDEALHCINSAIEMNPGESAHWSRLGRMLDHVERPQQALRCHDRALQLDPQLVVAWNNKGLSLVVDGLPGYMLPPAQVQQAIACFDKALELDVNSALAWLGKGLSLRALGRQREATRCLHRAVSLDAGFQDGWRALAETYQELGETTEAYEAAGKALMLNPEDPGSWCVRAAAERVMQRPAEALNAANRALDFNPFHSGAAAEKARALASLHRVKEALVAFEEALRLAPDDPVLLFQKGEVEISHGAWRSAERSLRQFLAVAPSELKTQRIDAERYLARLRKLP